MSRHFVRSFLTLAFFFALALNFSSANAQKRRTWDWPVTKTAWTEEDERGFGEFVKALAKTSCQTVDECLRSEANPYRDGDPTDVKFWSDCADWPYFLRGYYSWKNGLPFSYVSEVGSNAGTTEGVDGWVEQRVQYRDWFGNVRERVQMVWGKKPVDPRYSENGNYPNARRTVAPDARGNAVNFFESMDTLQNTVDTGFFRFHPETNAQVDTDFYPVDINPDAVKPGAVAYSPMGHVAIVYDVTPEGRILLFNAHPADKNKPGSGTPVSRSTFETRKEYVRSRAAHGSGLKQWRPFELQGAKWKNGRYTGGRIVFERNENLPWYSTVQFYGTAWNANEDTDATFDINGKTMSYEEFIRRRMATIKLDPVLDLDRKLKEACDLFKVRVNAVQDAVDFGVASQAHPANLPANIFSADGAWEDYSSPSRDIRLRIAFYNMRLDLLDQLKAIKSGDSTVVNRPNLRADLLATYKAASAACTITYRNSADQSVAISGFDSLVKRLPLMSFDPYHCAERRWGATDANELRYCRDDQTKTAWYQAEQTIRNYMDKDWKAEGPIRLEDARDGKLGFGKPGLPDLDIRAFIEKLPQ